MANQLPDGWDVVSLHYADSEPRLADNESFSDSDIAHADAIRVSYTPEDADDPTTWRTIHGADDWEELEHLIDHMMQYGSG